MSIRTRLLLSYIAMIFMPVVLFFLSITVLFAVFFRDDLSAKWLPNVWNTFQQRDDLFAGVRMMAEYDPERLLDHTFLSRIEDQLQELQAGLVILRNDNTVYVSPVLGISDWTEKLAQSNTKGSPWNANVKINGHSFTVKRYDFTYPDGIPGSLIMLSDSSRFYEFARSFFPVLFLVLLFAIGLTNGLLTFLVSRSIIKPLNALKRAAEQIKEGNLDHEVKLTRKDEIGKLGDAFEEMRLRLKESIRLQLQYEENRKELITNISHDLKTPITAIKACAEGVLEGIADTENKRNNYMRMIFNKATDMDRLIDELFLLSKLDLNKLPFQFEKMDLSAFLSELTEELRLIPHNRDIDFTFANTGKESVIVIADREKLRRVVMNIVDNSVKYIKDSGPKQIRLELTGGAHEATVTIRDNGLGIAKDALPHIFERFYRADPSRSGATGGSGLGLAIVKQIIEGHGGNIWADSEPGVGTRITFTLPAADRTKE